MKSLQRLIIFYLATWEGKTPLIIIRLSAIAVML